MTQNPASKRPRETVPNAVDVVVIGGGPAGAAVLWALERAAPGTRTVLIEKSDFLGSGSSLASLECFRSCWPTPCIARQMRFSLEVFLNAEEYLGEGAAEALAVRKQGYLFLAFTERGAATLKADVAHLHGNGLTHIEYLGADETRYRFPWLGPKVVAAKFDPMAGWLDSNALIHRYVQGAPSTRIVFGVPETRIIVERGAVSGVETPGGRIFAPNVVIAAGANAILVGRTAGVELPLVVRPRQSFSTAWRHEDIPPTAPMTIGAAPFPHFHPEAHSGAIFSWEYSWHNKVAGGAHGSNAARNAILTPVFPVERFKDLRFPSITLALLARQFGHKDGAGFADARYLRSLHHNAGYYVYRGDAAAYQVGADGTHQPYESERSILDEHPEVRGLFLSAAHAGHGIMTSPAAGDIIASKVLRQPLRDPLYAEFGLNAPWVAHDENAL